MSRYIPMTQRTLHIDYPTKELLTRIAHLRQLREEWARRMHDVLAVGLTFEGLDEVIDAYTEEWHRRHESTRLSEVV